MNIRMFVLTLGVLLILAAGINAFVSRDPKSPQKANTLQSSGPDQEANMRNTLATLLTSEGVRVDTSHLAVDSHAYRELRVRWQASTTAAPNTLLKESAPGKIKLLASAEKKGSLPRDRSLELSPNQILMIAVDGKASLRWWKLMLDPRLVRAEAPAVTGELKGEEYYLAAVDFVITYPDDPAISEVRLYHPRWTGKDFRLELLSSLDVD